MRGVGYISGNTLDQIQRQWSKLIDAEVNVIVLTGAGRYLSR